MSIFHAFVAIIAALFVGAGFGYSFRGRENRAINQAGQAIKNEVTKL